MIDSFLKFHIVSWPGPVKYVLHVIGKIIKQYLNYKFYDTMEVAANVNDDQTIAD